MITTETRSLIPTRTLVLSAVQSNGVLEAGPLFELVEVVGHSDKAMRDCLSRMVKEGTLTHRGGRGRKASYSATVSGRALLDADIAWTAFAHRVDAGLEPWDGCWRLTAFEIPEQRRGARDAVRSLLVELGAVPLQSGLYVHAYDLHPFTSQLTEHLDISAHVSSFSTRDLTIGSGPDPLPVAALFNLGGLAERYLDVAAQFGELVDVAAELGEAPLAAKMFATVATTEAILRDDPMLPTELLPASWEGTTARQMFLRAHHACCLHSPFYRDSQMMQTFVAEIDQALNESSRRFWTRWFPRLMTSYQSKLPPAAGA